MLNANRVATSTAHTIPGIRNECDGLFKSSGDGQRDPIVSVFPGRGKKSSPQNLDPRALSATKFDDRRALPSDGAHEFEGFTARTLPILAPVPAPFFQHDRLPDEILIEAIRCTAAPFRI